jgi:hypothetical protein
MPWTFLWLQYMINPNCLRNLSSQRRLRQIFQTHHILPSGKWRHAFLIESFRAWTSNLHISACRRAFCMIFFCAVRWTGPRHSEQFGSNWNVIIVINAMCILHYDFVVVAWEYSLLITTNRVLFRAITAHIGTCGLEEQKKKRTYKLLAYTRRYKIFEVYTCYALQL